LSLLHNERRAKLRVCWANWKPIRSCCGRGEGNHCWARGNHVRRVALCLFYVFWLNTWSMYWIYVWVPSTLINFRVSEKSQKPPGGLLIAARRHIRVLVLSRFFGWTA